MVEPVLAEAVRPVAEHLQSVQEQGDLQHYNERFDSQRQVADSMERLQPRGDLPATPALDPGGDPDIWRVTPAVILGPAADPVDKIEADLTDRLPDLASTEDPVLARLRDVVRPER